MNHKPIIKIFKILEVQNVTTWALMLLFMTWSYNSSSWAGNVCCKRSSMTYEKQEDHTSFSHELTAPLLTETDRQAETLSTSFAPVAPFQHENQEDVSALHLARSTLIDKELDPLLQNYLTTLHEGFYLTCSPISIFISYAWPKKPEELGIQPFLLKLVADLKKVGIHAQLDLINLKPGSRIDDFMSLGIETSSSVIVVSTPTYCDRAFQDTNVKYEYERILSHPTKAVSLHYRGDMTDAFEDSLSHHGVSTRFDFRQQELYYQQFPILLSALHEKSGRSSYNLSFQTQNYLDKVSRSLSSITPEQVRANIDMLHQEAIEKEKVRRQQVLDLAQNLPFDERFISPNWHIPQPVPYFIERPFLIEKINQILQQKSTIFLTGPEGIGKEQAALSYAKRYLGRYTFGAIIEEGNLESVMEKLGVSTYSELASRLQQEKYLLICPSIKDSSPLNQILSLPNTGHILVTTSEPRHTESLLIPPLEIADRVQLLTTLSGIEDAPSWSKIASRVGENTRNLIAVARYMQSNLVVSPAQMDSFFQPNLATIFAQSLMMGFQAALSQNFGALTSQVNSLFQSNSDADDILKEIYTWYKVKEVEFKRQTFRANLQNNISIQKEDQTDLSLQERIREHLLSSQIESLCEELAKKRPSLALKTIYIAGPWHPTQRTLLRLEKLLQAFKKIGINVHNDFHERNQEEDISSYMARVSKESDHVLLMGTPSLKAPDGQRVLNQIKLFFTQDKVIPLLIEGNFDVFPEEYKMILVEDITDPFKYSKSFLRVIKQLMDLDQKEEFKSITESYLKQIQDVDQGITEDLIQSQGTSIADQEIQKDCLTWLGIRTRADALGYPIPPKVWTIVKPDMTIGREDFIKGLNQRLTPLNNIRDCKKSVIVGLGGMGKSHMARQYASDHKSQYTSGFMVDGTSITTLHNGYKKFADSIGLTLPDNVDKAMEVFKSYLEAPQNAGWIVVVDNADTPQEIKKYLPERGGHLLITSRSQDWSPETILSLDHLDRKSSIALLKVQSGLATEEGAVELSEKLGDYPLALTQAAAYIKQNKIMSFKTYADLIESSGDLKSTISSTWAITLKKIQEQSSDGLSILQGMSFLAPDISHNFLKTWMQKRWALASGWSLDDRLGRALQTVKSYSMVEGDRKESHVHRLVQETLREALSLDEKVAYLIELLEIMDQELTKKFKNNDPSTWPMANAFYNHGAMLVSHSDILPKQAGEKLNQLSRTLGYLAGKGGKYHEALRHHEKNREIVEKTYGLDHYQLAQSFRDIGVAYAYLGDSEAQMDFLKRSLVLVEKIYGVNHFEVSSSLQFVGTVYYMSGKFDQYVEYLKRALVIVEKTCGIDHLNVAKILKSISLGHEKLRDYEQQLECLKKAFVIQEKVLEPGHPDIEKSLREIGTVYGNLGDSEQQQEYFQKAEELSLQDQKRVLKSLCDTAESYKKLRNYSQQLETLKKILVLQEKLLPSDHPDIAESFRAISLTYENLGNYQEQLNFVKKALVLYEKIHKDPHLDMAMCLQAMGSTYGRLGDYPQQASYLKRSLNMWEKIVAPTHIAYTGALTLLGMTYGKLGDYVQQLEYLKKALDIKEKLLGPENIEISSLLSCIGLTYGNLGDYVQQLDHLKRALEIDEKTSGMKSVQFSITLQNIGRAYGQWGDYELQLDSLMTALTLRERFYPQNHPEIGASLYELSLAYRNLEDYPKQLDYIQKAFAIEEKAYAPNHPFLAMTKIALGEAYKNLENYPESKKYLEEALDVFSKISVEPCKKVRALRLYGELHYKMEEKERALEILKETLSLQEEKVGRDHPDAAIVLRSLAKVEQSLNQTEESKVHLDRALEIQTLKLPAEHPEISKTRQLIKAFTNIMVPEDM